MSGAEPLAEIVQELDRCGIPHMLAGSFASAYHGEPRSTYDIDLVIAPAQPSLRRLCESLPAERFYISAVAVEEAWRRRGQFNVVHLDSGWKVDLIVRKDRPFSLSEFERREPATIHGARVYVATAEDTIIAKLERPRAGESERQLRDVRGVIRARRGDLDRAYLERWLTELGLRDLWARAELEAR